MLIFSCRGSRSAEIHSWWLWLMELTWFLCTFFLGLLDVSPALGGVLAVSSSVSLTPTLSEEDLICLDKAMFAPLPRVPDPLRMAVFCCCIILLSLFTLVCDLTTSAESCLSGLMPSSKICSLPFRLDSCLSDIGTSFLSLLCASCGGSVVSVTWAGSPCWLFSAHWEACTALCLLALRMPLSSPKMDISSLATSARPVGSMGINPDINVPSPDDRSSSSVAVVLALTVWRNNLTAITQASFFSFVIPPPKPLSIIIIQSIVPSVKRSISLCNSARMAAEPDLDHSLKTFSRVILYPLMKSERVTISFCIHSLRMASTSYFMYSLSASPGCGPPLPTPACGTWLPSPSSDADVSMTSNAFPKALNTSSIFRSRLLVRRALHTRSHLYRCTYASIQMMKPYTI